MIIRWDCKDKEDMITTPSVNHEADRCHLVIRAC